MLATPFTDGTEPHELRPDQEDFEARLVAFLDSPPRRPVVVRDLAGQVPWPKLADWFRRAERQGIPLRWVGGPLLAWELAGDLAISTLVDGPYCLGALTPAEMEPWAARSLGGDPPTAGASIPDPDRGPLLARLGGLLPVLESFRDWLLNSESGFPDPLRLQDAEQFQADLTSRTSKGAHYAERLANELPLELRVGLHHLFVGAHEWGDDDYQPSELAEISDYLRDLKTDDRLRLLDASTWLGFLQVVSVSGRLRIPHGSVLGLLIRHQRFAAP
jgi:hypothetical protein